MTRKRLLRYGAPIVIIIVGVLFAAVATDRLGNDIQTAATAGGLIWFITVVGRDMGMGIPKERRRLQLPPDEHRNGSDPARMSRNGSEPRPGPGGDGQSPVSPS